MRNVTVRFSLMSVLGLFSLMILLGAAVGVYSLGRANDSTQLVYQASASSMAINDAYKDTTRTRSAFVRAAAALTVKEGGDQEVKASALKNGLKTYDKTVKATEEFEKAAAFAGQDAATKTELVANAKALSATLNKAMTAINNNDAAAYQAINSKELTPAGAAFSASLEKYQAQVKELADNTVAEREKEYKSVIWLVLFGVLAVAVIVVAVQLLLRSIVLRPLNEAVGLLEQVAQGDLTMRIRDAGSNEIGRLFSGLRNMQQGLLRTVSEVRTGSDIINTGAQEIAAGNMDLSSRTETQASSLEETAASMEELTGTVRANAENARQANTLVQAASATAVKGGEVMGQMVGTMSDINDSSRKIVDIISVIDGIAFQTNILALNAAVEAARAGEQGRGFAVVASEVRNLAQRSAAAAKEIKSLIDDSVVKVDNGSKLVEQAGMTMSEVVDSVKRVTDIVSEIAEASREQSDGIEQVNQAITQMDEVTQQNAALVEQAAAATASLQTQATALSATVATFKIDASQVAVAVVAPAARQAPRQAPRPAAVRAPVRAPARASAKPLARPTAVASSSGLGRAKADSQDWEEF